jgi:hypothetical protein
MFWREIRPDYTLGEAETQRIRGVLGSLAICIQSGLQTV